MRKSFKNLTSLLATGVILASASTLIGAVTWTGSVNNTWNTTDANWAGDSSTYTDGDDVIFSGTSGEITGIVSRSPASTVVDSSNKVTFSTGIMGASKPIGGPSILTGSLVKNGTGELELGDPGLGQQFGAAADRNKYSNNFTSVTVNGGTLRIRSRAALGAGTVTLAGGTKFIQASEEARFGFGNEHIDNNFVLSGGMVEFPMAFSGDNKGVWIRNGVVSGLGGILVTGSSRTLGLSADNTFTGGVTIDTNSTPEIIMGSYTALGTGTYTASQGASGGGGLSAGTDLSGNATHPNGVTNDIVITAGDYFNVSCRNASASLRLGGDISGSGTLNKWRNDAVVTLSGTNTYSGGTIVSDGTLACAGAESLGSGPLNIASGAVLQLDFIGSRNVLSLTIGGVSLANGTYGSTASPAENQDDVHFSGTGMVSVGPPKDPTTTVLTQTGGTNPSEIGTSVTLTATVSGGAVTGTVSFYDGLTLLGSDTLDGTFQASISTSELPVGSRNIIAQYEGDATYANSVSPVLVITVVDSRPATTTVLALTSGSNPSELGASLTFTATVIGDSPTGQVTFYDRENVIGTSSLDGSFTATVTTSTLPAGPRAITAEYTGDLNNQPSADSYTQTVNPVEGNGKLKIFILAGQSNMEGHGRVEDGRDPENPGGSTIAGGIGSLRYATVREPKKYSFLEDPANPIGALPGWSTRSDVRISYWGNQGGGTGLRRSGILDPAFGVAAGRIGPEYGFGHTVGSGLDDDVLIIKTAWGGKSLYVDFRPPSSGGTTGPYYLDMVDKVNNVLGDLGTHFPGYSGSNYEIVGFGWHQGWNDRINSAATAEYEANLANLIRDVRLEFGVPELPFVIANSGMDNAPSGPGSLIEAQGNVSDPVLYPEFAGKVVTVDTRPYDFGIFQSPISQGFHWNGNGETYYLIGEAMGQAMLAVQPTAYEIWAGGSGQGLTAGVNDGPEDDPDKDGMLNRLEFVLGGNPSLQDPEKMPVAKPPSGNSWLFEYDRNKLSVPSVTQIVEHTTDFVSWTQVPIPLTSADTVTITPGATADKVSVAIPIVGGEVGFARLKVSE